MTTAGLVAAGAEVGAADGGGDDFGGVGLAVDEGGAGGWPWSHPKKAHVKSASAMIPVRGDTDCRCLAFNGTSILYARIRVVAKRFEFRDPIGTA